MGVIDQAIKAQLELLDQLPPELAKQYRELLKDSEQMLAACKRAKQRNDLPALLALQAQGEVFEQKLVVLASEFAAVQRAAAAASKQPA
jgi:hypothetical protein